MRRRQHEDNGCEGRAHQERQQELVERRTMEEEGRDGGQGRHDLCSGSQPDRAGTRRIRATAPDTAVPVLTMLDDDETIATFVGAWAILDQMGRSARTL